MSSQQRMVMANLKNPEWERHWDQQVEFREALPIEAHMGLEMEILEPKHYENHWGQDVEGIQDPLMDIQVIVVRGLN